MQPSNISKLFLMRKVQLLVTKNHISLLYIYGYICFSGQLYCYQKKKRKKKTPCIMWA